ncbi:MAG: TrkH family potassium uptake protein [Candidatus Hodarchaeota archaeon]
MGQKINFLSKRKHFQPAQVLVISFLILIVVGTLCLMLPQMVYGPHLDFIDALFTATSATCVTGLIVVDTGTRFTMLGQIIILVLLQLGGFGIMTLSTFSIFLIVGQFSIFDRDIIQETLTQKPIKNLATLLKMTFIFTVVIELMGAIILSYRFLNWFSLKQAVYYGIFHSISAFCNAGFSLFFNSFEEFKADYIINIVLMILIVLGGLGFIVLLDLKQGWKKRKNKILFELSFHSKIVLVITFFLIIFGATNFFVLENHNGLKDHALDTKIMASFFQSVTARTAGFNTLNISILSNTTLFFLIILMFIGGSPGSCAGGIKTSTFGVLLAFLVAKFKNQQEVNIFYRRLPQEIISRAISVTFFSITVIIMFTLILMISELGGISHQQSRGLFLEILFEVVSAFGTVGLSTGMTFDLSVFGKFLVSVVMFIGRLSPLTIVLAIGAKKPLKYKYPEENILVG